MTLTPASPCPCGRKDGRGAPTRFAACCGRFLADFDGKPAPDAERLMRSRYVAFVLEDADYLLATWHPSHRPRELSFEPGIKWLGLEVRAHHVADADHAEVEFVARSRLGGKASRMHERSLFVRETGRWYYLHGQGE